MIRIDLEAFDRLVAEGGVEVVDVREPDEWAQGHLPGARHVPLAAVRADPTKAAPNDGVIFVCAKGGRSATAAQLVASIGRQRVYSLDGGTSGWIAAGRPVVLPVAATTPAPDEPTPEEAAEPTLDALVGQNLREHRAAQGLSLDTLAREAGVSRTLLGQIELGRTAPSIGLVWKLAQTLAVPFSALLSTELRPGTIVTPRAKAKRLLGADGRFSSRALFSFGDAGAAEFYELWLAPHSREDAEPHRPGTRENLIVTAGALELQIGRDRRELVAGDSVVFSADVAHSYVNLGRDECWMYLVMNYQRGGSATPR